MLCELSLLINLKEGVLNTTPLSLSKFPFRKTVEPPWKEVEIRLEVDKMILSCLPSIQRP